MKRSPIWLMIPGGSACTSPIPGGNRIEVFDIRSRRFLEPLKVGNAALDGSDADGNTLYVVNTGGESITIVIPETMKVVDKGEVPADSFEHRTGDRDSVDHRGQPAGGAMFLSNTGQIWRIIGNEAVPRE